MASPWYASSPRMAWSGKAGGSRRRWRARPRRRRRRRGWRRPSTASSPRRGSSARRPRPRLGGGFGDGKFGRCHRGASCSGDAGRILGNQDDSPPRLYWAPPVPTFARPPPRPRRTRRPCPRRLSSSTSTAPCSTPWPTSPAPPTPRSRAKGCRPTPTPPTASSSATASTCSFAAPCRRPGARRRPDRPLRGRLPRDVCDIVERRLAAISRDRRAAGRPGRRRLPLAILSNKPDEFTRLCAEPYLRAWTWAAVVGQRDGDPTQARPDAALAIAGSSASPRGLRLRRRFERRHADRPGRRDVSRRRLVGLPHGRRSLRATGAAAIIESPGELLPLLDR